MVVLRQREERVHTVVRGSDAKWEETIEFLRISSVEDETLDLVKQC